MSPRAKFAHDIERAVLQMTMAAFAAAASDLDKIDADPQSIAEVRADFAVPILAGVLQAAAQFGWLTAPPTAERVSLERTLRAGTDAAVKRTVDQIPGPGEFWVSVAMCSAEGAPVDG